MKWETDSMKVVEWWRGAEAYGAARGGAGGQAGRVTDPAMRTACKVLIDFTSTPPKGHAAAATR